MQMKKLYETTNKKLRASRLRKDAMELHRAGFLDSAKQNYELAALIDPPVAQEGEYDNETDNRSGHSNRGGRSGRTNQQASRRVPATVHSLPVQRMPKAGARTAGRKAA